MAPTALSNPQMENTRSHHEQHKQGLFWIFTVSSAV